MITKWNKYAQTIGYILGRIQDSGFCLSKYEYLGFDPDTTEDVWKDTPDYEARTTYGMALGNREMYPDSTTIQVTCTFEERV